MIGVNIKSRDAFFHLINQAKQGNIELIFSKSNYHFEIFNYILTEYGISPSNETFIHNNQILFNQSGACVIYEINIPEYVLSKEEIDRYIEKLKSIPDEIAIFYEQKHLNNILGSFNNDSNKENANKKRKKI